MNRGNIINGYAILNDGQIIGGKSIVAFCKKGGKEFFIKKYLSPKYPTEDSLGSKLVKAKKKRVCDEFDRKQQNINNILKRSTVKDENLIVTIEHFRYGTSFYKVTEKINQSDLSPLQISKQPTGVKLEFLKKLAKSINVLHSNNIVHGDIKPTNVLVLEKGAVLIPKLIDFDDCFISGSPPQEIGGDQVYYSPEMLKYTSAKGVRNTIWIQSDIFALGLLLHEYMTGILPVFDKSKYNYPVESVIAGKELLFSSSLPPNLSKLIKKMLNSNHSIRPNIREVIKVLSDNKTTIISTSRLRGDLLSKIQNRKSPQIKGSIVK